MADEIKGKTISIRERPDAPWDDTWAKFDESLSQYGEIRFPKYPDLDNDFGQWDSRR